MLNFKTVSIITCLAFLGLVTTILLNDISAWWLLIPFSFWLVFTALGSGLIGWNYHVKALNYNSNTKNNHIAITFDDGPHPDFTPQVLELLKNHQAKATFFCIGKHIKNHPEIFKTIISQGHTIGNHTYSHANSFGFFSTEKVQEELQKTNAIIHQHSGLQAQLYRPAFGVTNPRIKKAVSHLKLTTIGWNKRSLDTTSLSEAAILKRATKNLKPGDVILLHDTSLKSVRVLEQLLLFLQHKNLKAVTIDTLFNIKAYA